MSISVGLALLATRSKRRTLSSLETSTSVRLSLTARIVPVPLAILSKTQEAEFRGEMGRHRQREAQLVVSSTTLAATSWVGLQFLRQMELTLFSAAMVLNLRLLRTEA